MRRLIIRYIISTLMLLVIPKSITAEEPVELVIWAERSTVEHLAPSVEDKNLYGVYLKEQFEREHPGVIITLEYQGWDEALRQNLLNSFLIGAAPDIIVGENYFHQYAMMGALVPLNEVIEDIKGDLIPGTYKAAQVNDTIYGISAFTGIFGFERNCQVIHDAGLKCETPPKTWDELLDQAKLITERGQGKYYGYTLQGPVGYPVGAILRIAVFLAQAGVSICRNNCSEPYFNDPKAVPVMEFLRKLNTYTPPGLTLNPREPQVYSALFQGRSTYQIAASWHPDWARESGCEDCCYSAVPTPEGGQPASVIVGNTIYAVLKQSKHPDIAAQWVKFLTRSDVQELVYPTLGRLPSTRSALSKLRPQVEAPLQVFIDELLHNQELGILPQWSNKPNELWQVYNTMLSQVLTSERPIPEIMDEAQASAEELLR